MAKRALEPKDIYSFRGVGGQTLSPNGRLLAYVVRRIDEEKDKAFTDIYLYDIVDEKTRRLTFTGKDGSPVFSPDGKRLAFISSRSGKSQIWILELSGGEPWMLPTQESVQGPLCWFADGGQIAYTAAVFSKGDDWVPYPGAPEYDSERLKKIAEKVNKGKNEDKSEDKKENNVKVITRFNYRRDGLGYLGDVRQHIFVTPVPAEAPLGELKPQSRQITGGDYDHRGVTISPDGKYIITSARRTETADYDQKSDLWLFEVESGREHLLYDAPGPSSAPLWSPCGKYLAFSGHDRSYGSTTTYHLWLLDISAALSSLEKKEKIEPLTEKQAVNITVQVDRPIGAFAGSDVGFRGGKQIVWKESELYFIMTDKGVPGIYKIDVTGDLQIETVLSDRGRVINGLDLAGEVMTYTYSTPVKPQEIYINDGEEKQVTGFNKEIIDQVHLGSWEYMPCVSDDGQEVDGWIIYPVNYKQGEKYPMLLLVHGGPHGAYGPAFMFGAQLFASQGYVVAYTNPRGSETYGQEFARIIDRNWGDRDYADVMSGVEAAVAKGCVDENNIFMHGWSYGGYMACWLATQTKRFKAICGGAVVSNMLSGFGTSDIPWADEWEYGGVPWQDFEHLIKHSAIGHAHKAETPVMLLHGENDFRCPIGQSEEFYRALKRLKKDVIMVRYPGEYHGLRRPLHQVDRYERMLAWFNYYKDQQ